VRRLLRYYRQFEGLSEAEVNERLRAESDERRARELARIEPLDLSRTTWPEYPPPAVVNAITYAARRGLHRYLDPHATALRSELAHHLDVDEDRVVVGGGIAQLMGAAAQALLEPGDELVTPWPSYPLYPAIARRSRGSAVPVPGFGPETILRAVNDRTRLVALCNPNDPTGELVAADDLAGLLDALPERVVVLLDEALRDFVDAEPRDAALALLPGHPRLLVFRTFSKAWGLAGLRCGYAVGGPGAEPLLAQLEPELGLNELAQAGALEALRAAARVVAGRAAAVARERARIAAGAAAAGLDVVPSQANVLWLAAPGMDGAELARRLERNAVLVAAGGALGDPARVRLTVPPDPAAADRALRALERAIAPGADGVWASARSGRGKPSAQCSSSPSSPSA
jgi:histidinol-phosphate aminotransferase